MLNQIPIEFLKIGNLNAMHLGKKFLATIFTFSAILYFSAVCTSNFCCSSTRKIFVKQQKEMIGLSFSDTNTCKYSCANNLNEEEIYYILELSMMMTKEKKAYSFYSSGRPYIVILFVNSSQLHLFTLSNPNGPINKI